jgi:hypothetical protein
MQGNAHPAQFSKKVRACLLPQCGRIRDANKPRRFIPASLLLGALQNERLSGQDITTDHAKATTAIDATAVA